MDENEKNKTKKQINRYYNETMKTKEPYSGKAISNIFELSKIAVENKNKNRKISNQALKQLQKIFLKHDSEGTRREAFRAFDHAKHGKIYAWD